VGALVPGTGIWVRTMAGEKYHGELVAVTDEKLSLNSDERGAPGRTMVLREVARADVKEVRLSAAGALMLVAAAIGGAAGAGIGAAVDASSKSNEDRGLATAVLGLLGAALGLVVSHHNPIIKGKMV
jgi:hypothetical protein